MHRSSAIAGFRAVLAESGELAMAGALMAPPVITVLMVDDEPLPARAAQRLLSTDPSIRFHVCSDPAAAPALAAAIRATVILQDMVMPETDGISMLRAFRAGAATRDVPIIVLSSEEEPSIKAAAFAAGADDYMVKFPDRIEMLARIHHHAGRYARRLEQEKAVAVLAESRHRLEAQSRLLRETFDRYLSHSVVERLLGSPEGLAMGGALRRVTIMMTDLRGFTALSERLPPEKMVVLINNYLDVMTEILVRYQATIDEFIGDAILAIFGAPLQRPDDAERAVACAVEMQLAMAEVNARGRAAGLPEVEMGIGLNTGEVVVGNIGSSKRAKYGVVGSAVNLTARIESYTTGGQVLISQATLDDAGGSVLVDERLEVTPKGVQQPIVIHRVGGVRGRYDLRLRGAALELEAPPIELTARFTVLDGKDAGGAPIEGRVVQLSPKAVEIISPSRLPALANLKLQLVAADRGVLVEDAYGKVIESGRGAGTFLVRFTSLPAEAAALFATLGAPPA